MSPLSRISTILNMSTPKPKSTPSFLSLPGEIRNQIYDSAPTKDLLPLFQTCKQIRTEGLPRTFSLYIGYWKNLPPLPPPHGTATDLIPLPLPHGPATELVQNLTIHVYLDDGTLRDYAVIATTFGGNALIRECCHVELKYDNTCKISSHGGDTELFQSLRSLTGFKRVVVELRHTGFETLRRFASHRHLVEEYEALAVQSHREVGLKARVALERALGKGVVGGEEENFVFFRPVEEGERREEARKKRGNLVI